MRNSYVRQVESEPPVRRRPLRSKRRAGVLVVVFAALSLLLIVLLLPDRVRNAPSSTYVTTPPPTAAVIADTSADVGAVARGQEIYAARCVACHGPGGKGDGPAAAGLNPAPVDFTNPIHSGHRREDQIAWVTNGLPPSAMPAFGSQLTPAEIEDVVDFVRSLGTAADGSVDTPGAELCTVPPTDPASLRTAPVDAPAPPPVPPPVVGPEFTWPQGEAASREEIDGTTAAIRLFVACSNAGDQARRLSLYTERFIGPQFDAMGAEAWQQLLAFAARPPAPLAVTEQTGIQELRDFRRLPDGRVGLYASTVDPVNHPHVTNAVLIFARQGDRWLIDEIHGDPNGVLQLTPTPGAPSLAMAGPETPVALDGLIVTLVEAPTQAGAGTLTLRVTDPQGDPVDGLTVMFAVDMVEMPMGVTTGTVTSSGDGRYTFQASFGMAGLWHIQGEIQRATGDPATFVFEVEIAPQ